MIGKAVLLIWIIWYLDTNRYTPFLFNLIQKFYNFYTDFFMFYTSIIYPYLDLDLFNDENLEINNIEFNTDIPPKEPSKYEDKYLEYIKTVNKEWEFTEDENYEIPKLIQDFCNSYIKTQTDRIEEITNEIINLENEIAEDSDSFTYDSDYDSDYDDLVHKNSLEERNECKKIYIQKLQEEANKIKFEIETDKGLSQINQNSIEQAIHYIINKRLDKLKNCYVIEKTPVGNVIMIYDTERETFKYYSDINIPYRYLEVVGRKYVKSFNCRPIFVDMEEELRLFEEQWNKKQELKKIKEEEDKNNSNETKKNQQSITEEKKKNIFAKFKSYNKDVGGKISMAVPPKNSIPNKSVTENKENEKFIFKARANRYTCEGKIANFNFLQKIDRRVFNKKLGLSFADFKKMEK